MCSHISGSHGKGRPPNRTKGGWHSGGGASTSPSNFEHGIARAEHPASGVLFNAIHLETKLGFTLPDTDIDNDEPLKQRRHRKVDCFIETDYGPVLASRDQKDFEDPQGKGTSDIREAQPLPTVDLTFADGKTRPISSHVPPQETMDCTKPAWVTQKPPGDLRAQNSWVNSGPTRSPNLPRSAGPEADVNYGNLRQETDVWNYASNG